MGWSYVQGNGTAAASGLIASLPGATPAGNLVLIGMTSYQPNNIPSLSTDNLGNTYTKAAQVSDGSGTIVTQIWYSFVTHPGTISFNAGGSFAALSIDEFSPPAGATTDHTSTGTGSGTAAAAGNTTVTALDLAYGVLGVGNTEGAHTASGGYTRTYTVTSVSGTNIGLAAEYKLDTTTNPENPGFTLGSSPTVAWTMVAASFQAPVPAVSGSSPLVPHL